MGGDAVKRSAFSLIELLAVLAIGTAILGPATVIFLETVRSTGLFIDACDTSHAVETALHHLGDDIHGATAAATDGAEGSVRLTLTLSGGEPAVWRFVSGDDEGFEPASLIRRCGDDEEHFVMYDVESVTFTPERTVPERTACAVTVEASLRGSTSGPAAAPQTILLRRYLSRVEWPAAGEVRE